MADGPARLHIRDLHMQAMSDHVRSLHVEEACGLLGGAADTVEVVIPVENELHSPSRYRMEPRAQIRALQSIEDGGYTLLGIYHSHPGGPSGLSSQDLREATYPEVAYLIWSPAGDGWRCRAFRLEQGEPREIPLVIARAVSPAGEHQQVDIR